MVLYGITRDCHVTWFVTLTRENRYSSIQHTTHTTRTMTAPPPPPPRRTAPAPYVSTSDPDPPTWKTKLKNKTSVWGKIAIDKSVVWSDSIGGRVNDVAEKHFGTEAFWPTTGDFPKEMDKAARILRAFTGECGTTQFRVREQAWQLTLSVDGIITEETVEVPDKLSNGKDRSKQRKVLRKIPPQVSPGMIHD
jgi:hypothetical protein